MANTYQKTGNKFSQKAIYYLLALSASIFILISTGCSPEKKLAKSFVKSHITGPALIFTPDRVYKYNLKPDTSSASGLTQEQKDSIAWFSSDLIKYIDDSSFLANYKKGYMKELAAFHIKTYSGNQTDRFFNNDSGGFVVNIAQIELDEQFYTYHDQTDLNGIAYEHHHLLNALDVNSWFEVRLVNSPDSSHVLFSENLLTDDFDGFFEQNPFNNQMQYFFHLDSLTPNKIYRDAYDLGRTYADYTYDYLLNRYLDKHLPANLRSDKYFRYDPYRKVFFTAGDEDRFDVIKRTKQVK